MAITTLVVLSSVATRPEGWEQLGQWTGSIQLVGGAPWAYVHVLQVQAPPQATPAPSQRLDAEQRRRLFSATWTCATEEEVRADLSLLFGDPVVIGDPRDSACPAYWADGWVLSHDQWRSRVDVARWVTEFLPDTENGRVASHVLAGWRPGMVRASAKAELVAQPAIGEPGPGRPLVDGAQSEGSVVQVGHVRQALTRALTFAGDSKALDRLPEHERTVEGLARAYLPSLLWLDRDGTRMHEDTLAALQFTRWHHPLYVYERSMAHALLVLIALASGHDPGLYGLSVQFDRVDDPGDNEEKIACAGWFLYTPTGGLDWFDDNEDDQAACAVAAELDPVRASVLALLHVLAAKAGEAEATS